jgi:PAS domain S-box-containing protein
MAAFIGVTVFVALLAVANEYFDPSSLIFRTPPAPVSWPEVIFEILIILITGLSLSLLLTRLLSRQKQTEEALLYSKEQNLLLQKHASEGIMVIQDGVIKLANSRAVRFLAHKDKVLYSRQFIEFVHKDDRRIATRRYLASINSKQLLPVCYTYRFITKKGNIKWAETTSTECIWEKKSAVLVFLTDVTGRKKTEESLRNSEERYRTISEDMEKGYYETDLSGNVTFANDSICRVLGYSSKEITGTNYRKYAYDEENVNQKRREAIYGSIHCSQVR